MTTNNFNITLTSTANPLRRRAALNQVYSLLMELAEKTSDPDNSCEEQEPVATDECVISEPPQMLGGVGVAGLDGRDNIHDGQHLNYSRIAAGRNSEFKTDTHNSQHKTDKHNLSELHIAQEI